MRRQVSWLAGRHLLLPSRYDPVAYLQGLSAYSCGGSRGIDPADPDRTAFPFRLLRCRKRTVRDSVSPVARSCQCVAKTIARQRFSAIVPAVVGA